MSPGTLTIRPFGAADAEACFRIRTEAFVRDFYPHQDPQVIAEGINAYLPSDYVRLGETARVRVATDVDQVVGFYVVRFPEPGVAELMLLYVKAGYKGQGLGTLLLRHLESWLAESHPEVRRVVLDTIVPGFNGQFYEKQGYAADGVSELRYPGLTVKAVRMAKKL